MKYDGSEMYEGRSLTREEANRVRWLVDHEGVQTALYRLGIRSYNVLQDAMRADATPMMSEIIRTRLSKMALPPEASELPPPKLAL